jgi:nucleotide-binding universal stress UspA family protein
MFVAMTAPIVVGIDAQRASGDALFWAMAEARRRSTWVLLVHAADSADAEVAASSGVTTSARAAALIRAQRRVATRLAPDVRTLGQVAGGAVADVLAEATRRAEVLVIGSRGRAGMAESALGPVSHRLVAHAHCPVVVVPPGCSRLVTRRIAVGVADRAVGHPVIDVAAEQARRWAATLCLVHAQGSGSGEAAQEELDAAALHVRRHCPDVVVERVAPLGDAATVLLAEAARSDLVVLGSRHTDEQFSCRIGAVPVGVLSQVGCPVALVGRPS